MNGRLFSQTPDGKIYPHFVINGGKEIFKSLWKIAFQRREVFPRYRTGREESKSFSSLVFRINTRAILGRSLQFSSLPLPLLPNSKSWKRSVRCRKDRSWDDRIYHIYIRVYIYICRFSYRSVLLPAVIGQLSGFFFKRFRGERGTREGMGGREDWLAWKSVLSSSGSDIAAPLSPSTGWFFYFRIGENSIADPIVEFSNACSRNSRAGGWKWSLSSKKLWRNREPNEIFFITPLFLQRRKQNILRFL